MIHSTSTYFLPYTLTNEKKKQECSHREKEKKMYLPIFFLFYVPYNSRYYEIYRVCIQIIAKTKEMDNNCFC